MGCKILLHCDFVLIRTAAVMWPLSCSSSTFCEIQLVHKSKIAAGEKYESWKWQIQVKYLPPAKVAIWRRIELECWRQNQWVNKSAIVQVASWDVQKSNKHPTGHARPLLSVLEGCKVKFPTCRGIETPTHFQQQVRRGTWLSPSGLLTSSFVRRKGKNIHSNFESVVIFFKYCHTKKLVEWLVTRGGREV